MAIELSAIDADTLDAAWPHLEPHIARACDRLLTEWTPELALSRAREGKLQLWAVYDTDAPSPFPFLGAFATALRTVKGEKVAEFSMLGGHNLDLWLDYMAGEIERVAKQLGATRLIIEGRLGWARRMRAHGYRPVRITIEKDI